MIEISLCMIVKNEEAVLSRCLESVKDLVDEIIIVDTGSSDRTKEIAGSYTDHIFDFEWCDDFAAARNFAFSKASKQYCMWLDADDIITEEDQNKFRILKQSYSNVVDVFMLPYHAGFDQQGNLTMSYYRERIIKKQDQFLWQGVVHEAITPFGRIIHENAAVTHKKPESKSGYSTRNLDIYRKQSENGKEFSPREQFYFGRELYAHKYFDEAIQMLDTFLKDGKGWVENNIEACKGLAYCYSQKSDPEAALASLFRTFHFDTPRAEICCDIGAHFLGIKKYQQAIYWYKQALSIERKDSSGAFVSPDSYGYLPSIQLCVCYSKIGDIKTAIEYNEKAGSYKPDNIHYKNNKEYFRKLLENQNA